MPNPPSADHWPRFRRLMRLVALVAVLLVPLVLGGLLLAGVELRLHMVIAMTLGIALATLLAGALMGLVFVSARSGHDETIGEP